MVAGLIMQEAETPASSEGPTSLWTQGSILRPHETTGDDDSLFSAGGISGCVAAIRLRQRQAGPCKRFQLGSDVLGSGALGLRVVTPARRAEVMRFVGWGERSEAQPGNAHHRIVGLRCAHPNLVCYLRLV